MQIEVLVPKIQVKQLLADESIASEDITVTQVEQDMGTFLVQYSPVRMTAEELAELLTRDEFEFQTGSKLKFKTLKVLPNGDIGVVYADGLT